MNEKLIKKLRKSKVGFALAGGSLKGIAAHTGFMKAMAELEIEPSAIIGTSAGSLVGGYMSLRKVNKDNVEKLIQIVSNLTAKDYVDKVSIFTHIVNVFRGLKGLKGVIKGDRFEKYLDGILNQSEFSDCIIPFYAHVGNIDKAREEVVGVGHKERKMARPCRASSTIPMAFEPVDMYDRDGEICEFVDGGVTGLHAVEELAMRHPGLDYIITNDFHLHDEKKRPIKDKKLYPIKLIYKMYDMAANEFEKQRRAIMEQNKIEHINVNPVIPYSVELQKPRKEDLINVINCGYEETLRILGA